VRPYYEDAAVTIYLGDCRDILPTLVGVTALITDPPYGVGVKANYGERGRSALAASNNYPQIHGDDAPFDPAHLLGYPKVVLFGANHYAARLPSSPTWIVWDKLAGLTSKREIGFNDQADVELAWSNAGGPARIYAHRWMGLLKDSEREDSRVHPTQKPVALMTWVLRAYTDSEDVICDPYMGSGSTLVAAKALGRKSIGIEISQEYCDIAVKRLAQDTLWGVA